MHIGPSDATEIKIFRTIGCAPGADPGIFVRGTVSSLVPPLEVGSPLNPLLRVPLKPARGFGEHYKVPYRGLGQNPS